MEEKDGKNKKDVRLSVVEYCGADYHIFCNCSFLSEVIFMGDQLYHMVSRGGNVRYGTDD